MKIDKNKLVTYLKGFDIEGYDEAMLSKKLVSLDDDPIVLWDAGYEVEDHLVILVSAGKTLSDQLSSISKSLEQNKKRFEVFKPKKMPDDNAKSSSELLDSEKKLSVDIFELSSNPLSSGRTIEDIRVFKKKCAEQINENYKELLQQSGRVIKPTEIVFRHLLVNMRDSKSHITIKIDSRIRSLQHEEIFNNEESNIKLKSYVFSADLKSLLELYRIYGPDLFYKNVRNGIADELGVENAIRETINNKDEKKFWYLNNGISLFVQKHELMDFSFFDRITIDLSNSMDLPVSVINGAQSITTAAKYYDKVENQKVLLRIYSFEYEEKPDVDLEVNRKIANKLIDEVTIALNRQKPIKADDLAYTNDFVKIINENYNKNDPFSFEIIRRGVIGGKESYSLLSFAKIVSAYLAGKPSKSISKGAVSFLKKGVDETFTDKEVFKPDLIQAIDNQNEIIQKYYKPVNFAFQLKKYLEGKLEEIIKSVVNEDENILAIKSLKEYGVYFVLALVIHLIAKEDKIDTNDFSDWKYYDLSVEKEVANGGNQQDESEQERVINENVGKNGFIEEKKINEYVEQIIAAYLKYSKSLKWDNKDYRSIMKNNETYDKTREYLDEK